MALDVKVKIELSRWIGSTGFGYPLIFSIGAAKAYTECASLEEVVTAGFAATTDTYKIASNIFAQDNAPQKIAVCGVAAPTGSETLDLSPIQNRDWRQLIATGLDSEGTYLTAIMTYVAATKNKMFFACVASSADLEDLSSSDRIVGFVHTDVNAVGALVGASAGCDVGSINYKNLILKGISPMNFTDSQIEAIHTAKGLTVVTKAEENVTTDGKTTSGQYIDIVDAKDYIVSQLEYKTQTLLNQQKKIPYNNVGIAQLESVADDVLLDAYNKGIISTNSDGTADYKVNYMLREETSASDRSIRKYIGGRFTATLAGAVNEVEINGTIEI